MQKPSSTVLTVKPEASSDGVSPTSFTKRWVLNNRVEFVDSFKPTIFNRSSKNARFTSITSITEVGRMPAEESRLLNQRFDCLRLIFQMDDDLVDDVHSSISTIIAGQREDSEFELARTVTLSDVIAKIIEAPERVPFDFDEDDL